MPTSLEALKKRFGEEYPAAITAGGTRMTLSKERRFTRHYRAADGRKMHSHLSRFMDDSASITASELQSEWPNWTDDIRRDFCSACSWLHSQPDFPEMLRFIMRQNACNDLLSDLAMDIAVVLPREEAFQYLVQILHRLPLNESTNFVQAISITKHPDAERTLRNHLAAIWAEPKLWNDDSFNNRFAYTATTGIAHLIELGASPADFDDKVRQLSGHPCAGNRKSVRYFLSKYYSWLKTPPSA